MLAIVALETLHRGTHLSQRRAESNERTARGTDDNFLAAPDQLNLNVLRPSEILRNADGLRGTVAVELRPVWVLMDRHRKLRLKGWRHR